MVYALSYTLIQFSIIINPLQEHVSARSLTESITIAIYGTASVVGMTRIGSYIKQGVHVLGLKFWCTLVLKTIVKRSALIKSCIKGSSVQL